MDYKLVKDESGKVIDIEVNGKPITRGSMRGFRKAQTTNYFHIFETGRPAANPFSGEQVELNGLELTVYTFVKLWEQRYNRAVDTGTFPIKLLTGTPVQCFDDMRAFFRELNSDAYDRLLD